MGSPRRRQATSGLRRSANRLRIRSTVPTPLSGLTREPDLQAADHVRIRLSPSDARSVGGDSRRCMNPPTLSRSPRMRLASAGVAAVPSIRHGGGGWCMRQPHSLLGTHRRIDPGGAFMTVPDRSHQGLLDRPEPSPCFGSRRVARSPVVRSKRRPPAESLRPGIARSGRKSRSRRRYGSRGTPQTGASVRWVPLRP